MIVFLFWNKVERTHPRFEEKMVIPISSTEQLLFVFSEFLGYGQAVVALELL